MRKDRVEILKTYFAYVRQADALNKKVWPEYFGGRAFNIDLTWDEFYDKIHNDPDFLPKYILATNMCIPWEEAEKHFEFQLAHKQKVQDKISRYQNSGRSRWRQHPEKPMQFRMNEPGKQKDYDNPHKARKKPTRADISDSFKAYNDWVKRWPEIAEIFMTEKARPWDLEENPFDKDR